MAASPHELARSLRVSLGGFLVLDGPYSGLLTSALRQLTLNSPPNTRAEGFSEGSTAQARFRNMFQAIADACMAEVGFRS